MTAAGFHSTFRGLKGHCLKKKMTKTVIIFLKQIMFISGFLIKNSNATENYSVYITEIVPLRGVN